MAIKPHKLVIIGAGKVGDAVLSDAMKAGLFGEIVILDMKQEMAQGEALDQHHATALPLVPNVKVYAGDYRDCEDADIIVIAAGPSISIVPGKPIPADTRRHLAKTNAGVIRSVMAQIVEYTREAAIIICSNPVDALVHLASTEFDYPHNLIMGTGTILDSARMCRTIADHLDVDPEYIRGYMLGEHGPTAFPMVSGVNVAGVGFDDLPALFGVDSLDVGELTRIINKAGFDIVSYKGWTSAGISQSVLTIIEGILLDNHAIFPLCSTLRGEYGYDGDVSLSIPTVIGAQGIVRRLEVPLNEWEKQQLDASAAAVKETIALAQEK